MKQNEIQKENPLKVEMIEIAELKVGDKVVIDINHQVSPEWVMEVERIQSESDAYGIVREYEIVVDFKRNDDFPSWAMKRRQIFEGYVLVVR